MLELELLDRLKGGNPKLWCWRCRRFTEHLVNLSYRERGHRIQDTTTCLICGKLKPPQ